MLELDPVLDPMEESDVLEGDEGEPEVGRHRDVGREMLETPISELKRSPAVTVSPEATVAKAAELMRKKKVGVVLVKKGAKLLGLFALGAAYVATGSVNQSCVESGTSDSVRQMLQWPISRVIGIVESS